MYASQFNSVKINFVRSDGHRATIQIKKGQKITVGRDPNTSLLLEGRKISRKHTEISLIEDGRLFVEDLGSHNGTFIDGVRIKKMTLIGDEILTIGEWEGSFSNVEENIFRPAEYSQKNTIYSTNDDDHNPFIVPTSDNLTIEQLSKVQNKPNLFHTSDSDKPEYDQAQSSSNNTADTIKRKAISLKDLDSAEAMEQNPWIESPDKDIWNWDEEDEAQSVVYDEVRSLPVKENPLVKRFAKSNSGELDLRSLAFYDANDKKNSPESNIDAIALKLVFQFTEALQKSVNIKDFLEEMVTNLFASSRAKAIVILLPDNETGRLTPRIIRNRRSDEKVQISRTILNTAVNSQIALTSEDAGEDQRFAAGESVLRFNLKAVLVVPLMSEGRVLGAIYLTRDLPFSNTERDLVAALGHLMAIGLQRSKLQQEIQIQEKQKNALARFHAPDVVKKLMMREKNAQNKGLFLESLEATVLFCDLSGFTSFCESKSPEMVGALLNHHLGTMTEIVFQYGGTVDKYIGDAVMCIFGAPFSAPDDPIRAVKCAIHMRDAFETIIKKEWGNHLLPHMHVHIGINSGKVVAGTIGSQSRMEYTALGDTVNIAARLEGIAESGEIILGQSTAAKVGREIEVESRGSIQLKGRAEAVNIYAIPKSSFNKNLF